MFVSHVSRLSSEGEGRDDSKTGQTWGVRRVLRTEAGGLPR